MRSSRLRALPALIAACAAAACAVPGPAAPPAALGAVSGEAFVRRGPHGDWSPAAAGAELAAGDAVKTGTEGGAVLVFARGLKIRLEQSSVLALEDLRGSVRAKLELGYLEAWSPKRGRRLKLACPSAVATMRASHVRVHADSSGAAVWDVFEGKARVRTSLGQKAKLSAGQHVADDSRGALSPEEYVVPTLSSAPEPLNDEKPKTLKN